MYRTLQLADKKYSLALDMITHLIRKEPSKCPQLILQESNGEFQRNLFFKVQEGVRHFPGGGVQLFPGGGSNCLFPIETHITCDFPGGGGVLTPCPPSGSALALYGMSQSSINGRRFSAENNSCS